MSGSVLLKTVPAFAALITLSACQTTALPKSCTVSADDIQSAQTLFITSFEKVNTGKGVSEPRLSKVFASPVTVTSETLSDKSTLNYKWDVDIAKGCTLTANLGTDSSAIEGPEYTVKTLTLKATAKGQSDPYFYPVSITLNK